MDSPYQTPAEPAKAFSDGNVAGLFEPLYRRRLWLRIIGVMTILGGALYTLSIFGAIFGIPMIFAGVYLMQAAGHFESGFSGNPTRLYEGADKLSLALQIAGILILVSIVITILYFIFAIVFLSWGTFTVMNSAP